MSPDHYFLDDMPFVAFGALGQPVVDGKFVLTPNVHVFESLVSILQNSTFCKKDGWNNCGSFYHVEGRDMMGWEKWHGSNGTPGLLWYYWRLKRREFYRDMTLWEFARHTKARPGTTALAETCNTIEHPEYLDLIDKYGLDLLK
jgi:hypothetical protein